MALLFAVALPQRVRDGPAEYGVMREVLLVVAAVAVTAFAAPKIIADAGQRTLPECGRDAVLVGRGHFDGAERQDGGLGYWDRYQCADRGDVGPSITSNDRGVFRAGKEYGVCVERAKLDPRASNDCIDFASP